LILQHQILQLATQYVIAPDTQQIGELRIAVQDGIAMHDYYLVQPIAQRRKQQLRFDRRGSLHLGLSGAQDQMIHRGEQPHQFGVVRVIVETAPKLATDRHRLDLLRQSVHRSQFTPLHQAQHQQQHRAREQKAQHPDD
jgi:hypothetical protein